MPRLSPLSLLPALLLPTLLLPSCILLKVHEGSGIAAEQLRDPGVFTALSATTELAVVVEEGEQPQVTVRCDDNLIEDIRTEVEGDTLRIWTESPEGTPVILRNHVRCEVAVVATGLLSLEHSGSGELEATAAGLQRLSLSGSGDVHLFEEVITPQFSASLTGSGELIADGLVVGSANLVLSGSGGVEVLSGSADILSLVMSGSGESQLFRVEAVTADVTLTGSGDAELTATEAVHAVLTGSGALRLHGDPAEREVVSTGSGDVSFLD